MQIDYRMETTDVLFEKAEYPSRLVAVSAHEGSRTHDGEATTKDRDRIPISHYHTLDVLVLFVFPHSPHLNTMDFLRRPFSR